MAAQDKTSWQAFSSARVKDLTAEGLTSRDAMKRASEEWQAGAKRTGGRVAKSKLVIEYIKAVDGTLSEEQAKDIALGLLDGLLEWADAEHSTEYATMARRAAELFRGDERSADDSAERQFGVDLAEYLILALIDRGVSWDELQPTVLQGADTGGEPPADPFAGGGGGGGIDRAPTPEEELGLAPPPRGGGSLRGKVAGSAVKETIRQLERIINE